MSTSGYLDEERAEATIPRIRTPYVAKDTVNLIFALSSLAGEANN